MPKETKVGPAKTAQEGLTQRPNFFRYQSDGICEEASPIQKVLTPRFTGHEEAFANILVSDTEGHAQMLFVRALTCQGSFDSTMRT